MAAPKPKDVALEWQGRDLVFRGEGAGRAPITVDGDNAAGPGPMETLLLALAACSASDVLIIAKKKRLDLRGLRVEVHGERREEYPQRYRSLRLVYRVTGPATAEAALRQAIDLSLEKYCSVTHSLAADLLPIPYELVLQA